MKLRTYLTAAAGVSIGIILLSLFVCYRYMLLNVPQTMLLASVTLGAATVSFVVHYALTRRLEASLNRLTEATERVAEGQFHGGVAVDGPVEFRRLGDSFNRMSQKLEISFERLHTSEASRRELVVSVSHDLRTPMASIQSFVEALQDEVVQDKATFDRYLRTIGTETQRLSGLVDDLFELSQLHAGARDWRPELVHLDSLIVDTLQSCELMLEEKGLEVQVRMPDSLPKLPVMASELKRVLANLLQNAIRHSPEGGHIGIAVTELGGEFVQVAVEDEGEGIAEEDAARVFERFYRADRSRARTSGGAGLGLAIAKSIVERHGGQIGVDSVPGEGSRFWFTVAVHGGGGV